MEESCLLSLPKKKKMWCYQRERQRKIKGSRRWWGSCTIYKD